VSVATLAELGRLRLDVPLDEWFTAAADPRSVQLLPVSPQVAVEIARLPETFQRDPADGIIVATSRALGIPLVTHDDRIRRSRLATLWRA
jgi:PIN domain nuclease of toxin-antitoxin system